MITAAIVCCQPAAAQSQPHYDSSYVISYADKVTGRAYFSQKYTLFVAEAPEGIKDLQYRPNTSLNLGVGATYRSLTLNLAYGFPFINQYKADRGRTRYLDLQSHIYGYEWSVDLFGQFYKGYYLYPEKLASLAPETYYKRPDLRVQEMGVHAYYIFNNRQFSYRAAFVQNAWQKKSAGSFLLGGGITYGRVQADSNFVPATLASNYYQKDVNGLKYFEMGPGIAYAYTYVYREHWFATAAATLSLDLGIVTETAGSRSPRNTNFSPNFLFRAVAGYNGALWSVNLSWVTNRTSIRGENRMGGYHVTTGNYRFTVARRFDAGTTLKKILGPHQ